VVLFYFVLNINVFSISVGTYVEDVYLGIRDVIKEMRVNMFERGKVKHTRFKHYCLKIQIRTVKKIDIVNIILLKSIHCFQF